MTAIFDKVLGHGCCLPDLSLMKSKFLGQNLLKEVHLIFFSSHKK
jgi:hypothetical protein